MKKTFLVSLFALFALVLTSAFLVAAADLDVTVDEVLIDDMDPDAASIEAGEVVPIDIYFTADENASEVEISAWLQGYRSDAVDKDFADLIEGKDYHAKLSLRIPTDIDPEEELDLYVRIESDEGNWEDSFELGVQRKPYKADILFVESDSEVTAGSTLAIDIVVKNMGRQELEDLIVGASILELGIQKRAYFGDLTPLDVCDDDDDCDEEDAVERRIYLRIPTNAETGIYELEVEAHTRKTDSLVRKSIAIVGAELETKVVVPVRSKEIRVDEVVDYDLIIVNSGSKIGIYEIIPETAEGVLVQVDQPIVTVKAGSSELVKIKVKGLEKGTYSFAFNVNSGNELVQRVVLNANVSGQAFGGNIAILTVVLAIIFVVLLIVLIVLLTRKPERMEELEESYY